MAHQPGERVALIQAGFLVGDAGHGFFHQQPAVINIQKQFQQAVPLLPGRGTAFLNKIAHKGLADSRLIQAFRDHVAQVDNLRPLIAQGLREQVMLALGALQERDVVKQHPAQMRRGELLKLRPRAVHQNFFQRADLTEHSDSHGMSSLAFILFLILPCLCMSA